MANLNITPISQSGFKAYQAVAQIVPTATQVRLILDTESYDTQSEFSSNITAGTTDAATSGTTLVATAAIFVAGDVGKWVWNTTDNTYTTITAFTNTTTVTVGAAIFATGETFKFYDSVFTATVTGYYSVIYSLDFNTAGAGTKINLILKRSGTQVADYQVYSGASDRFAGNYTDIIYMTAGQTLTFEFAQASGGNLTVLGGNYPDYCHVSMQRLS